MSGGEKKAKSTGVTFRLNEPGMGEHERAGLAGLCLSLTAAIVWEKQGRTLPLPKTVEKSLDRLRETVSNLDTPFVEDGLGICLEWSEGNEKAVLEAVVKWAWQVHDGVFFLPGVHRKREHLDCDHLRLHVHNGLLGTFFQFPTTITKEKDPERKVVRFDEEKTFSVSYRRISSDAKLPQHKAIPPKGICGNDTVKAMSSWIYPGSEPRFNNNLSGIQRETGWRGPARFAYLMLFAPIACHYIKLPRSNADNWAYMIPSVENLRGYQRDFLRRNLVNFGNWPFYGEVSGLEDAALRYATRSNASNQSVTVVMGKASFYHAQQKTRNNLWREFTSSDDTSMVFRRYDIFNRVFPAGNMARPTREPKPEESNQKGSHFIVLPNCRERITANILCGDPWYADLAYIPFWQRDRVENDCQNVRERGLSAVGLDLLWKNGDQEKASISPERLWFLKLHHFERKQLMSIANENNLWDDPQEKDMLDAFRGALRRLLNREDAALGRGGSRDLSKRWDNTADRWHRRLLHAKTKLLLATVVHELLAQAARSPGPRDGNLVEPGGPAFLLSRISEDESDESRRMRNNAFQAEFRRMVNHPSDWKKVRDLALLALTTFTDSRLVRNEYNQPT
ncbi:MAG: type I-MYXAN CRISPR-associated Cas8a1/Cmx1 [Gemmatimonadetes bacterium]|nr:type I-MYXAN CRISPR-associated Cas8a1/Cmx1 [Gemmatimonadota bacterium]